MAGFFDGEGCIRINRIKQKRFSVRHSLYVSIGQNDGAIMDWIVGNFGGGVLPVKRDGSFYWYIQNNKASSFLKEILPFLRYKRPQAELGIRFMGRIHKRGVRGQKLSEHEIRIRDSFFMEMKRLKKIYKDCSNVNMKGAGATTK